MSAFDNHNPSKDAAWLTRLGSVGRGAPTCSRGRCYCHIFTLLRSCKNIKHRDLFSNIDFSISLQHWRL